MLIEIKSVNKFWIENKIYKIVPKKLNKNGKIEVERNLKYWK